jgi:hypothetical protein
MSIDLTSLAAQLTSLSNDDAATLLDAISGLTERAQKAREERARAEAERDAHALTCGCGEPVTQYRWLECVQHDVRLGVHRRNDNEPLRGGYIADGDTWDGSQNIPSDNPVFKTTWFKCGNNTCKAWVEVAHDKSPIVGWE